MPTQVIMPALGESVDEATITKWLKAEGDPVEEYEPLLEVNTDKVDSEIPSPASGVLLKIIVPEGTTVEAGSELAWIGEAGESVPSAGEGTAVQEPAPATTPEANVPPIAPEKEPAKPAPAAPTDQSKPMEAPSQAAAKRPAAQVSAPSANVPTPGRDRDLGFISPVVAKIASEEGVDLYQVQGSGQGGRITKKDVLAYLEQRAKPEQPPAAAPKAEPQPTAPQPAAQPPAAMPQPMPGDVLPMTPVRRAIAEHMVASKRTSPHVTTIMEADLSRVVAHRQANKANFERDGAKLTFTPYFVSAAVSALKAYPIVNSSWSEEGILLHRAVNIGMATSLGEAGLIVPVIKNADSMSLLGLARTVNDLAQRARSRQLQPDEVKGGTFTITNHGTSGSLFATPIINQPQCGILGVGAIQKRVIVVAGPDGSDVIAIRPMVYLSLTFDHRILDGAVADYFLGKVVETLQNWK